MIELRDYQVALIDQARTLMGKGCRSFILQSPTGSGKTLLTAHMLKTAASKGMSSFFLCHRRELIQQSIRTFDKVGINFGIIAAGFQPDRSKLIQICSVQTLARRWKNFKQPKLIIWDEVHHIASKSWAQIFGYYPGAFHVGLTATPERLDGKGLGKWFKEMIHGPAVATLIDQGYLSKYKIYAPGNIDVTGVHKQMGDFNKKELASVVDKPTIIGNAVNHYLKFAPGKRALVRAVSIEHSKHVAAQFNASGIPAAHVDGETLREERDHAMRLFVEGKLLVLSFVDLFSEGIDVPGIEAVIDLRPTQSLTLWLQFCGRALRPSPGKEFAIICDAVGNTIRHGFPDEERNWTLSDRESRKKATNDEGSVKVCPACFAAQFPGVTLCKFCGHVFEIKAREVEQVEGELTEVDIEAIRRERKREQGRAQTFEDLVEMGRRRGYKSPWAWAKHIMNARQSRKLAGV